MARIAAVRAALATALSGVASDPPLVATAKVPDAVNTLPAAYVQPVDGDRGVTFDGPVSPGLAENRFIVVLLVSRTDDQASQDRLDDLMSECWDALEAPGVLDEHDVMVPGWQNYGWRTAGDNTTYLGVELRVVVSGPGD